MDDFDRPVVCIAGLPFDLIDMAGAVARVRTAAKNCQPCFLTTPNLNFLIGCLDDSDFRDSVIHSDLCIADGMPLVWMAWLLGIPIPERVAGSGLFEVLRSEKSIAPPLKVYFFGGPDGVAKQACRILGVESLGLECVGFDCPGFGSVEAMSGTETIANINASGADFVVVALGARKGQAWIERNRGRIDAPVISHLGAVVNFVAGTVTRAPSWMQETGLEWLWRIKEEPALWRRYWQDGVALVRLLLLRILPYAFWRRLHRPRDGEGDFAVILSPQPDEVVRLVVSGDAPDDLLAHVREAFRTAAAAKRPLVIDLARATSLSPAFGGLILMLKKQQDAHDLPLRCEGIMPPLRRHFLWNGLEHML
jgi:N-acetylglucosaminyldiphosphoundecaprenol N-acetyl-beta-D-mannosaminyltransferase